MIEPKKKDVKELDAKIKSKILRKQQDLPKSLTGCGTNKYGGTQLSTFKGLRGQKYGAASKGHRYSAEELEEYANQNGLSVAHSK